MLADMRCDNYVIVYSVETYRIKNYLTTIRNHICFIRNVNAIVRGAQ